MSDDDMCPNCVTPWKCNGPHLAACAHDLVSREDDTGLWTCDDCCQPFAAPSVPLPVDGLLADIFTYIDALLNADLSYTELPEGDPRAAAARWPLTDSRVCVEQVIEADTWIEELDALKARAALAAPATAPGLDVERLARAMRVSLDIYGWPLDAMAADIAAEYARLTGEERP